jgi:hypothetical protein
MRVGVYVDGFNLYYGARGMCGRGTPGWRWLDIRGLAESLLPPSWQNSKIERVVYCTARISDPDNPTGTQEQDLYLRALTEGGIVDVIELGNYVSRVKCAPLARRSKRGRPIIVTSDWPIKVQDQAGNDSENARYIVSYAHREEKASDVNVAAHLLVDMFEQRIDAAIVISNDSDLRFAVRRARESIPVGMVNPTKSYLAGDLKGDRDDGVGTHWWRQLTAESFYDNQLLQKVGRYRKPLAW